MITVELWDVWATGGPNGEFLIEDALNEKAARALAFKLNERGQPDDLVYVARPR